MSDYIRRARKLHFPAWWGDMPPHERARVYAGGVRRKAEKAQDRLNHALHWCTWDTDKWVSDTRAMLRLLEPCTVREGKEMPLVWCNAFDELAHRDQRASTTVIESDAVDVGCARLIVAGNPQLEQLIGRDYFELVQHVYGKHAEWRVAPNPADPATVYLRGPVIDISGARSAKLVAVVMPVRPK